MQTGAFRLIPKRLRTDKDGKRRGWWLMFFGVFSLFSYLLLLLFLKGVFYEVVFVDGCLWCHGV